MLNLSYLPQDQGWCLGDWERALQYQRWSKKVPGPGSEGQHTGPEAPFPRSLSLLSNPWSLHPATINPKLAAPASVSALLVLWYSILSLTRDHCPCPPSWGGGCVPVWLVSPHLVVRAAEALLVLAGSTPSRCARQNLWPSPRPPSRICPSALTLVQSTT